MLREVLEAKKYFGARFGMGEHIPDGTYAIPCETSKGDAFMRIECYNEEWTGTKNFMLFWDEELKLSWYDNEKPKTIKQSNFALAYRIFRSECE